MSRLSINDAWNDTAEIVRRDFGALFTVALALVALPSVLLQALGPYLVGPGQGGGAALWLLLALLVAAANIAGTLAISTLALGRENIVGRAIAHGFRRLPSLFGASFLVGVAAMILFVPILFLTGVRAEAIATNNPEALRKLGLAVLIFILLFAGIGIRLMLMTPVAAAEAQGPIGLMRRSWALTRGHFWRLLGFVALVVCAYLVLFLALTAVLGILVSLLLGKPEPGNLSALVLLLLTSVANAAFSVVFTSFVARIYARLAGSEPAVPTTGS